MRIDDALNRATKLLKNCERPRLEAELLLSFFLDCRRIDLHLNGIKEIEELGFFELVKQRMEDVPLEYITKKASFYDEEFFVDRGVLIPRPETEILVDIALETIDKHKIGKLLEIGVGSGIISAILKKKRGDLQITACDISQKALEIARKNFLEKGLSIELVESDLFENIVGEFPLVVSNPPYIKNSYKIPKNLTYEPQNALFGGEGGDEILKKIIDQSLNRGVRYLICEMGYDQRGLISKYLDQKGKGNYNFYQDLSGFDRGFIVEF